MRFRDVTTVLNGLLAGEEDVPEELHCKELPVSASFSFAIFASSTSPAAPYTSLDHNSQA